MRGRRDALPLGFKILAVLLTLHWKVNGQDTDDKRCVPNSGVPSAPVDTEYQLRELRALMLTAQVKAYIVPTDDAHQSEYVSAHDDRRTYISGFSGSAGTAVILSDKAGLWTDGRYFLQGTNELSCSWTLMKSGLAGVPTIDEWLLQNLNPGDKVGADSTLLSIDAWKSHSDSLSSKNITLVSKNDLVDQVWNRDPNSDNRRPPMSDSELLILNLTYSGRTWQDKIADVQKRMEGNAETLMIAGLDEVAWLFNLRGADIAYNPVFFAYAIVPKTGLPRLYLRGFSGRIRSIAAHLRAADDGSCPASPCVHVLSYDKFFEDLGKPTVVSGPAWISSALSYAIKERVMSIGGIKIIEDRSPIKIMKAMKNPVEQEGMKRSHIKDSTAIIKFVSRLEEEVRSGVEWDELKVSAQILAERGTMPGNKGASFGTIAGYGSNGAVIHYSPASDTNKQVSTDNLLLLDSGGQYLDGTTDITRTFHFGTPTAEQVEAYTLVLKGVITLGSAVWPANVTKGGYLDPYARRALWSRGLNYRHGTGHGIGMFLSVHEGPANIGSRVGENSSPIYPGMFFSDEPGFYKDGHFGIRLETIVMTEVADTPYNFGGGSYLHFVPVALVPFEPNLIDLSLLTNEERDWLNSYHQKCQDTIGPQVSGDSRAANWLRARTGPVPMRVDVVSSSPPVYGVSLAVLLLSAAAAALIGTGDQRL